MTPCSKATIMIVLLSIYYVIKIDCLPLTWNQDTEQTPSSIPHPAHSGLAQFPLSFDSLLDRLMRVAQKRNQISVAQTSVLVIDPLKCHLLLVEAC